MVGLSILQQTGVKSRCLLLSFFASLLALVLALAGSVPCEAQSVPLRIDTHFYQKRTPTPPTFGVPGVLDVQEKVLPSGERVKVYQNTGIRAWPEGGVGAKAIPSNSIRAWPEGGVGATPIPTNGIRTWPGGGVGATGATGTAPAPIRRWP